MSAKRMNTYMYVKIKRKFETSIFESIKNRERETGEINGEKCSTEGHDNLTANDQEKEPSILQSCRDTSH